MEVTLNFAQAWLLSLQIFGRENNFQTFDAVKLSVVFDSNRLVGPDEHSHQKFESDQVVVHRPRVQFVQIIRCIQNISRYSRAF